MQLMWPVNVLDLDQSHQFSYNPLPTDVADGLAPQVIP